MKIGCLRIATLAMVVPVLFGCAAKNYDALVPDVQANFEAIKSYQVTPTLYIPQAGTDVETEVFFKAPNKVRTNTTYPISVSIVCDGTKISGCVPDYNTCLSMDLADDAPPIPPIVVLRLITPHLNCVGLTDKYRIVATEKDEVDGEKLIVFDLARKSPPTKPFQAAKARMWVAEDKPVAMKMEMCDEDGACKIRVHLADYVEISEVWVPQDLKFETGDGMLLVSLTAKDIKINPELPDSQFVFNPPDDAIVMDEIPGGGAGALPEILILD